MTGNVTHHASVTSFLFHNYITVGFYMRQQPYEISDTDICYGWNCVFILHFL